MSIFPLGEVDSSRFLGFFRNSKGGTLGNIYTPFFLVGKWSFGRSLLRLVQSPFGVHVIIPPAREGFLWGHRGWRERDGVDVISKNNDRSIACDDARESFLKNISILRR